MKDFFISYNKNDQKWAEWIAWQLEEVGYSTVLQAWDFKPGSNFVLEMHTAAQSAQRTIAVLSPDYLNSNYTLSEWAAAFADDPTAKKGKLLPIRVKKCDPEGLLQQIVYIDFVAKGQKEARELLLSGITRVRQKPTSVPIFPGTEIKEDRIIAPTKQKTSKISLLHLSDFWFGFTKDRKMHWHLLENLLLNVITIYKNSNSNIDSVLITGDITYSAQIDEFDLAYQILSEFCEAFDLNLPENCFFVPGNHDVNWSTIGPADQLILGTLSTEEDKASILAHPPTMELLSARIGNFCDFTRKALGKARAWRRDRPWRVDVQTISNLNIAFMQLNSVWTLGPRNSEPIVGEFQFREALSEAGDCEMRVWLLHHPITKLPVNESNRINRLLEEQDGVDLVFTGTRHSNDIDLGKKMLSSRGLYEFASGPMFPGLVEPRCSIIEIDINKGVADLKCYNYERQSQRWISDDSHLRKSDSTKFNIPFHPTVANGDKKKPFFAELDVIAVKKKKLDSDEIAGKPFGTNEKMTPGNKKHSKKFVSESVFRDAVGDRPVLIITAVDIELRAVLDFLKPLYRKRNILQGHIGQETYYTGRYGVEKAIITMCGMGAIGRDSVILATQQAVNEFKPKAIIMIGIAFGKEPLKQNLGDVLVASQVASYEQQRIGEKNVIYRGTIAQCGPILLNRFRQALDWRFISEQGREIRFQVGPILSGEKLIDQSQYKNELFGAFPQAIGGEMEGAGLYAVAARSGLEWIIVKGICDWADGTKNDDAQPLAATTAASLVYHVLSDSTVLEAMY